MGIFLDGGAKGNQAAKPLLEGRILGTMWRGGPIGYDGRKRFSCWNSTAKSQFQWLLAVLTIIPLSPKAFRVVKTD